MAIYTVQVQARKRPVRTFVRRRLTGTPRGLARAAKRYLGLVLGYDTRTAARGPDTSAEKLILRGSGPAQQALIKAINILNEALNDQLRIVRG